MPTRTYKRGSEFPHEGFVQGAIEAHFRAAGFELEHHKRIDLVCRHPATGETWQVEAKGVTTQVGLDFRTGIGQLVQGMRSETTKYGIAVPDVPAFREQISCVSPWVVEALGLHWLFVAADGAIEMQSPVRSNRSVNADAQSHLADAPHRSMVAGCVRR